VLTVLATGLVVAFLYFARDVVVPIALAIQLSFLLAPAVRWLRRGHLGRVSSVALTVLIAFLAILEFAAIVVQEISSLAKQLPEYRSNLEAKIRSLPGAVPGGGALRRATSMVQELGRELKQYESQSSISAPGRSAPGASTVEPPKPVPVEIQRPELEPLQVVQNIVGPLLQPLAMMGLVIVFVVMILLEREDLRDRVLRLAGRSDLHRTTVAMDDAARRMSRYLSRQLLVNACCGLPIGFGLALIGIPNAALWGIFAALLRFLPYLGIVIAACFPIALALAVDPGSRLDAAGLGNPFVCRIRARRRQPARALGLRRQYGSVLGRADCSSDFLDLAMGAIGLLLSTPLTVCLFVLGRHVPQLEFLDVMLGNEPVLAPDETFYQRLLANDPEEAIEQAEEFLKERSLAELFDDVALPALVRAQVDSDEGAFSPERRLLFKEGIRAMLEDLADNEAADTTAEHSAPPVLREATGIVCVAGRNELDEAAASLLVHLLRSEHSVNIAEALPAEALTSDRYQSALERASVICLSLISTNSPVRARYLVRRLCRRAPRAKVLVGFWRLDPAELTATVAAIARPNTAAVTSLREAIISLQSDLSTDGGAAPAGPAIRATAVG
jgi:predicted PurR-regulated permease PerM